MSYTQFCFLTGSSGGSSLAAGGVSFVSGSASVVEPRATTSSGSAGSIIGSGIPFSSREGCACSGGRIVSSASKSNLAVSIATSRSQVRLKSSEALRNSARPFPMDRANCGNLRGPKNMSAMTRMKSSSALLRDSRIRPNTVRFYLPRNCEMPRGGCSLSGRVSSAAAIVTRCD